MRAFGTIEEIGRQVSQKRTIEVQFLASEEVASAATVIRQSLEPAAEVTESLTEAVVRFRTAMPERELGGLLKQLILSGANVTQFREVQTDLEEAFISFTRPQEPDSARGKAVDSV